jgi:hypothetical protein
MEEKETMKNSVKSKRNRVHYMAHVSLFSPKTPQVRSLRALCENLKIKIGQIGY